MKITLTDLVNLQNETTAVNNINDNNAVIETAFDNTLSRDGTSPNVMNANLDMNSNRILNLPSAVSSLEPMRLQDLANYATGGTVTLNNLPTGGTSGQVLAKNSSSNYDASWVTSSSVGITSITAGSGLDGGTITSTGTVSLSSARRTLPTTTTLTSGSAATYTTPANCLYLKVHMVGGGGGGCGTTNGTTGLIVVGTAGSSSSFNSIVASGGGTGGAASTNPGLSTAGIGGTGGVGTATLRKQGSAGQSGQITTGFVSVSRGGDSHLGAGASPVTVIAGANGNSAAANTGGGGSGALGGSATNVSGAAGGGGEYAYILIISPAATYSYTIGAGGTGGIGGNFTGGAGGSGVIFIEEFYN